MLPAVLEFSMRNLVGIGLLLFVPAWGQTQPTLVRLVEETVNPVVITPAKQNCENWSFAAAVQSVLKAQDVPLGQEHWVTKLSGGDACDSALRDPQQLKRSVEGDYRLTDIRTVHLEVRLENTSVDPGQLVRSIRENRPFLLIWKRHAFVVVGITYLETVDKDIHDYNIQQMKLMDPAAGPEQQPAIFRKTPETLQQVDGIMEIIATNTS
jgi:hypothetical protein